MILIKVRQLPHLQKQNINSFWTHSVLTIWRNIVYASVYRSFTCLVCTKDLFMIQTSQNIKSSMSFAIALSFADSAFLTEIRSKRRKHEANSLEATVCPNNENSMQKFSFELFIFFPEISESHYYIKNHIESY